jgi:cysteinyl-tRNA synthetase
MAGKYVGDEFDIHGGGLDLRFPHHENELAQSRAVGRPFARWWMHNAMVNLGGEKMSKSVGNTLLVSEVVQRVPAAALRYYLATPHYRSVIEFSEAALQEAVSAYERLAGFVERAAEVVGAGSDPASTPVPAEFAAAMDDDVSVPQAIAVVHDTVREGNAALAAGDKATVADALSRTRVMLDILGLDPLSPTWQRQAGGDTRAVADALVAIIAKQRADARARKDFAAADEIRDALTVAGVTLEDTPAGPRWNVGQG